MTVACRTCPSCQTNWPISGYGLCPVCRTPTRYATERSIPSKDVERTINAMKFDRYYQRREDERLRRGDPSPEQLGSADAIKQLKGDKGEKQEI
jgi:hypothetical protein